MGGAGTKIDFSKKSPKFVFFFMRLFEKWSPLHLSNYFKMAVAPCNKNVITSLRDAVPTETHQKKVMGNLCLLATNRKKKTGAFLKKTSPTVLRLGVLTHTEPVKILFNHISVEQLWVFLFHVALLQVIRV